MALLIQTTGLEEYAPGGTARIKVLNIGGPGAGKTRWSSFFPKPIYADCEKGLASVADRTVPYVNIKHSQDMLDLLAMLKQECAQPADQRRFDTVVIDTLDAFQRKIKNEWMEKEKKQTFTGWEAWGYLNSRMQLLMTRLLNLDMNVIVNVHYKDKKTKDDETGKESHELMLQLQGDLADTAFNDFDLVGWTGVYWEAVDGERVQKRGITFRPTPDKPFLKDRLHVTPPWLEIAFAPSDYEALFERIQAKIADLDDSGVMGEVPTEEVQPSNFVIPPGAVGGGAIPGAAEANLNLSYAQMDKPTLAKLCRDRGIETTVDGTPIRSNTLKAELIATLENNDAAPAAAATPPAPDPKPEPKSEPAPAAAEPAPTQSVEPQPVQVAETPGIVGDFSQYKQQPAPLANTKRTQLKDVPGVGTVDTATGEVQAEPSMEEASATLTDQLGAQVVLDKATPVEAPAAQPAAEQPSATSVADECEDCGKNLSGEDPDFVKLSWIKFRERLCEDDFRKRKAAGRR